MSADKESPVTSDQAEVIEFLGRADTYGGAVTNVDRIETHGALVFMAGEDVYKIKRAVHFSYMDFSTLELRRRVCAKEIEINRPLAPEIYLGVVSVTREDDGTLAIGGRGPAVEWAVHMRRFAQSDVLGSVVERDGIGAELARAIADAVFEHHRTASVERGGRTAHRLDDVVTEIADGLAALTGHVEAGAVAGLATGCRQRLAAAAKVIERRSAEGFVRRCHGDLHLDNIVLWRGRPTLFDAIEFDEALATIDTLYDLAFLLMDLDRRHHRAAANMVLNRYLWRSQSLLDIEGLVAMPLYLALRAGIRAMVRGQRAAQRGEAAGGPNLALVREYLEAALGYLSPAAPRLIAVGGLSGTGKSTLAAALAPSIGAAPGAVHLRSDLERKAMFGAAETDRLADECYTPAAGERVYALLLAKARAALEAGSSVVVDAAHLHAGERLCIGQLARELAVPFFGLWLEASRKVLVERVAGRVGDASDATVDVVLRQLARNVDGGGWTQIDAGGAAGATLAAALAVPGIAGENSAAR